MSAQIISFRSARNLPRCELVPAGGLAPERALERHMARIGRLLRELEELGHLAEDCPPDVQDRARVTIERARRLLNPSRNDDESDPQPEIDPELLERLYRDLKP